MSQTPKQPSNNDLAADRTELLKNHVPFYTESTDFYPISEVRSPILYGADLVGWVSFPQPNKSFTITVR
jgi:hypothetical protein